MARAGVWIERNIGGVTVWTLFIPKDDFQKIVEVEKYAREAFIGPELESILDGGTVQFVELEAGPGEERNLLRMSDEAVVLPPIIGREQIVVDALRIMAA